MTVPGEVRTGVRLAFDALGGVVRVVQDMHRAIAKRGLGPVGELQSALAAPVYAAIRAGLAVGGAAAHAVLPDAAGALPVKLTGALNGAVGDRLARDYPALATRLHATGDGPVGGHVVVFLHGLVHTELHWGHGDLAAEVGASAVHVRYNSGRDITANAADLAALLEVLVTDHPVTRLSLVGHSMGGLVARAAVHRAVAEGGTWLPPLGDVVCLGSPHLGSPVERGAAVMALLLNGFPESAPLGALVDRRSAGIKDLAHGTPYQAAPQVRQHFLAATVAANPAGLPGRLVGDLLVSTASATDPAQRADRHVLGGVSHLGLLRHPEVRARLVEILAGP
ncbi:alpha/beta fold hydrolase [Umezawaea tangerina]|uniref:Alpha/beta hydrolase family protein n=1 Tax=Umezawaea tangerina TaxID=84725 RepID=A0A2T0SK53_9PSEU|nr:alpha/beta fold hydrolase [Umezawaea tangerina]PRY33763.1 alpha/beta hydrolase family protein [Umezawaea tangerina]